MICILCNNKIAVNDTRLLLNIEIKELQQKVLELLKLYNDLKSESDIAHQDISNNIKNIMSDVKHAHQDSHSKDSEFKEYVKPIVQKENPLEGIVFAERIVNKDGSESIREKKE